MSNAPSHVRVLIVIVNYCSHKYTIECLKSLQPEMNDPAFATVVVADNCSSDGSYEIISDAIESNSWKSIHLIKLARNGGFAYGNNGGIRYGIDLGISFDYILLLNPDTITHKDAVQNLVQFMDTHEDAGIGCARLENEDGSPQVAAFRFPSILGEFERAARFGVVSRILAPWTLAPAVQLRAHKTDWVAGACMIIRRPVFDQVGYMDDQYFLYFEEVDYCLQARKRGWSTWYIPKSRVVHFVGKVTKVDDRIANPRVPKYWFESRKRFFTKNFGLLYATFADMSWVMGYILWRMRAFIQRKKIDDPQSLLPDFLRQTALIVTLKKHFSQRSAGDQRS